MLQSYMLTYNHLRNYLEIYSFKFNPYDPCVTNNIIEGGPLTIVFILDELKEIHKDTKVLDRFEKNY